MKRTDNIILGLGVAGAFGLMLVYQVLSQANFQSQNVEKITVGSCIGSNSFVPTQHCNDPKAGGSCGARIETTDRCSSNLVVKGCDDTSSRGSTEVESEKYGSYAITTCSSTYIAYDTCLYIPYTNTCEPYGSSYTKACGVYPGPGGC